MAILNTHQEAAYAVADLNRAGFAIRKILIISNCCPTGEITRKIRNWQSLCAAWATIGCLNAIDAGLEFLGMTVADRVRCTAAMNKEMILVVLKGTPNEVIRARVCLDKRGLMRRVRT